MVTKVFVHLNHLKLPQIGQTYLKIFVWLEHLMKEVQDKVEKQFAFVSINKRN